MTARDLMTPDVLTVREDMSVTELTTFLIDHEITGTAVLNEESRPVGVVSMADIAAQAGERGEIARDKSHPDFYVRGWEEIQDEREMVGLHIENVDLLVRDIMNSTVYSVADDARISEVARMMLGGHLHRILVTREGSLVGIISSSDFMKLFLTQISEEVATPA